MRLSEGVHTGTVAVIGAVSAAPVRAERDHGALAELAGVPLLADRTGELESAWRACEDAGIGADDRARVGVYSTAGDENGAGGGLGSEGGAETASEAETEPRAAAETQAESVAEGRSPAAELARALGLTGPCRTGQTPLAEAIAAVLSGACELALVGTAGAFAVLTRQD
ncbi:hypothetical protein RMO59_39095, partial [Streptomyces alfalfae]